tara:strand:+ start:5417 stop:6253 length:837 start_codon:yes stop_codon:yes gene_type:complete
MPDLVNLVPAIVRQTLTASEENYLTEVFTRFNGYPSLTQLWRLMDECWVAYGCDCDDIDERVEAFYRHPVWLLNGLFTEQHSQSIDNRRKVTLWAAARDPVRIADFGGGFGGLARSIGKSLPSSQVEVVDPYPHPAAIAYAENTHNVRFVPELTGDYDVLIAADVFEHVPDPVGLAAGTASHLRDGGQYLIANCFQPVILCHLPQLFHLGYAWDHVMSRMGLLPGERVAHGRVYSRMGDLRLEDARVAGEQARRLSPLIKKLPLGRGKIGGLLVRAFC